MRMGFRLDRSGFGDKTEGSRGFTSTATKGLQDCPLGAFSYLRLTALVTRVVARSFGITSWFAIERNAELSSEALLG